MSWSRVVLASAYQCARDVMWREGQCGGDYFRRFNRPFPGGREATGRGGVNATSGVTAPMPVYYPPDQQTWMPRCAAYHRVFAFI